MEVRHHIVTNRRKLLILSFGGLVVLALLIWSGVALLPPMPPRTVAMAIYPEGSFNAEMVKRYQEILARDGVELKAVPSPGAIESLARLRDPKSGTSIALIPGGLTTEQDSPELVSLGTMFYRALWIFARSHLPQRHGPLRGLRISIGPEGSSSHTLALKFLGRAGVIDRNSATLLPLTPSESAQKLIRGEIDVAIFLDAWDSPAVQQLLNNKDVELESIQRADAFVALYPYLDKLVLPAGVVDMAEPRPPADVLLIATKSSLAVRKDLHPAIQYLLLEAAVEIHSTPGMFHTPGQFPAAESIDLPLSPYARDFYKTGPPFLQRHLPFWLAVFLKQVLILLIPLIAILLPMLRFAPVMYDWLEKRRVYRLYSELRHIEDEMFFAAPDGTQKNFIERLDRLKDRASRLSVPIPFKPQVYALRVYIDMVRHEAEKLISPQG
jgi:TRAP-type uncharacterized transport system substrate-binding protein